MRVGRQPRLTGIVPSADLGGADPLPGAMCKELAEGPSRVLGWGQLPS